MYNIFTMPDKLMISLLGQPQIMLDACPVKINRRQTRALLFFLAASGGMVGRSELIDKFFGVEEISDEVARRRLRELISKLRSELPDPEMMITVNDQVGLSTEWVIVDVAEFERLYGSVEAHLKKHVYGQALPARILPLLENAVALWHGSDFLQGLILDNELQRWQTEKNAHLWELRENLLKHLAGHAAAINDLESAAHWLRTALEPNQYSNVDEVYHYLIILKSLGRLNEALKLAVLLKKRYEMDIETMPGELENLCSGIINQFSSESGSDWDALGKNFSIPTRLVGRQKELSKLQAAYCEKQAVIIWGDTGMGKSRLVHEFYRTLPSQPQLMVATCRQMEQNQPFEPLMDMLEQCMTFADWDLVDQTTLEKLVPYIPDTIRRLNKVVQLETAQLLPQMVNEAICNVLQLKAASTRVLIFIENVQWCDESSLNALAHLLKRDFFKQQGFLVLTGLVSEKKAAFDAFINAINRHVHPYEIVFLNGLKEEDVRQLAEELLGTTLSTEMVRKMTAESGGSPFIISEYLRWHLQKNPGKSPEEMMKDTTLPSNIGSLMRTRLKELYPQLRQVINAAAVVGEQFTLDSVAAVSDLKKEEVVDALERMEDMHLIKPVAKYDPIGGYTFTYPRMRQVVLNEIKSVRKQLMYQYMANYLEARSGQRLARPTVLAQYFQNGGDDVKAFFYWHQAAENAFQKVSLAETRAALISAEEILLRQPELFNDEQVIQFFNLYVDFCRSQMDDKTLARITHITLDLGQRRSSHLLLGTGLRYKSLVEMRDERLLVALQTIMDAARHLKTTPAVHELLRVYNLSGILHHQANRLDECRQIFEKTLQMAEKAHADYPSDVRIERELARAENGMATIDLYHGLPQIAVTRIERAIEGMEMSFDYHSLSHAQVTLAEAFFQMGDYTQAMEAAGRAVRTASALQDRDLMASAQIIFAQTSILCGNLDEGWMVLEKANEICETHHLVDQTARIHSIRGLTFRLLQANEKAIDEYRLAASLKGNTYTTTEALLNYAMSLISANQHEAGNVYLKESLGIIDRNEFAALRFTIETFQAFQIGNQGDFDRACQLLDVLAEKTNQRALKQIASMIYYRYGSFMLAKGNFSVASRLVQSLLSLDTIPGPWTVIMGLALMHQVNQHQGRSDETPRQRLLEILDTLGSKTTLEPLKSQFRFFAEDRLRLFVNQSRVHDLSTQ
jgi:tetratricopeptide (TPR) repeat protein